MLYKNYIWDFDGTIVDSYPHILAAFCEVLAEDGILDRYNSDEIYGYLRVSFGAALRFTGITREQYDRFSEKHHRIGDDEIEPKVTLYRDAEKVLKAVCNGGGRNYIYTHRNYTVKYYLEKFGLQKYFSGMVTSEDGFPSKPAPNAVLSIMEKNSLDPGETIMIGDREIDGLSGRNAGIASALVNFPKVLPGGEVTAEVSTLDYVCDTLTDLAKKLEIF